MVEVISQQEWQKLPKEAQQEVLDFFLFIKAKYAGSNPVSEAALLSEEALARDWLSDHEEEAWSEFQ